MFKELETVHPQTAKERHSIFLYFTIVATAAFALLTAIVKTNPLLPFDLTVSRSIQMIRIPGFDPLMRFLTILGNAPEELVLPILAALFLAIIKLKKEALMLLVSSEGAGLISEVFKRIVGRPRPDSNLIIQIGEFSKHDSFPSGHVLFFIGFFGFLAYLAYIRLKKNWLRQVILTFFLLVILLIGVSRIYLGAHWFSDTLGSYLIGSVWLYIVIQISSKLK